MTAGYEFHPEAETDLDEIWEYIAADNIAAADRVISEINEALENLAPFPHTGHRRHDLTGRPLHFKRVREYLIAYAPDERPLWVVAVLHGHRSPRVLAAITAKPGKLTTPPVSTEGFAAIMAAWTTTSGGRWTARPKTPATNSAPVQSSRKIWKSCTTVPFFPVTTVRWPTEWRLSATAPQNRAAP